MKERPLIKRKVYYIAQDIMTAEPVCAQPSTSIRQLARLFEENEISGCPVVDHAGKLVGVVSKTDLIRRCSEGTSKIPPSYLFEVLCEIGGGIGASSQSPIPEPLICVHDFMNETPVTVRPTATVQEIAAMMAEKHIHRVVVVDDEHFPLGMVTSLDVLKVFPPPSAHTAL